MVGFILQVPPSSFKLLGLRGERQMVDLSCLSRVFFVGPSLVTFRCIQITCCTSVWLNTDITKRSFAFHLGKALKKWVFPIPTFDTLEKEFDTLEKEVESVSPPQRNHRPSRIGISCSPWRVVPTTWATIARHRCWPTWRRQTISHADPIKKNLDPEAAAKWTSFGVPNLENGSFMVRLA